MQARERRSPACGTGRASYFCGIASLTSRPVDCDGGEEDERTNNDRYETSTAKKSFPEVEKIINQVVKIDFTKSIRKIKVSAQDGKIKSFYHYKVRTIHVKI